MVTEILRKKCEKDKCFETEKDFKKVTWYWTKYKKQKGMISVPGKNQ